jgi:hypothetical protein
LEERFKKEKVVNRRIYLLKLPLEVIRPRIQFRSLGDFSVHGNKAVCMPNVAFEASDVQGSNFFNEQGKSGIN